MEPVPARVGVSAELDEVENMIAFPDQRVRYMTVRESARVQRFPDNYAFLGSWTEAMRQLGNAVPVTLAQVVGHSVARALERDSAQKSVHHEPRESEAIQSA